MIRFAHIAGIPVEETLGLFGPAAAIALAALGATVRSRGFRIRRRRSHDPGSEAQR
jgi:hypothetical protein